MKNIFLILVLITTLAFTGCSQEKEMDVQDNNNIENINSNQYDISGYWKVTSEKVATGYYIVEFRNDNVMIEYLPSNNAIKNTYEIKDKSIDNLSILTSSGTLINLNKIDDFNMDISYDTVVEHAIKISKADFKELLSELSEFNDDTIIYNSYYQEYDENYTNIEETEINVEDNDTYIEKTEIDVEDNDVYIEETEIDVEDNDTYIEETEIDVEDNDVYIEETEIDVEDNDAYIEETEVDVEDNDVYIEETEIDVEDNDAYIEEDDISVEG